MGFLPKRNKTEVNFTYIYICQIVKQYIAYLFKQCQFTKLKHERETVRASLVKNNYTKCMTIKASLHVGRNMLIVTILRHMSKL